MSKEFRYHMTTKDFLDVAKHHGFRVSCAEKGRDKFQIHMDHPDLPEAKGIMAPTAKHGEANSNLVKYAVRVLKQIKQHARAAEAEKAQPTPAVTTSAPQYATPAPTVATIETAKVQHATDNLAAWLDDRIREGLRQFPASMINNWTRKKIGLPDHKATVAALETLVRRNLLGEGLINKNGKRYKAYRIHPKLTNGLSLVEAYDSDAWKNLPAAPPFDIKQPMEVDVPKPKPLPKPAPVRATAPAPVKAAAPQPASAPEPASFEDVLIQEAAGDEDFVKQLIDFYINSGRYDKLAEVVVKSSSVEACERILRRVAELAPHAK